MKLGEKISQQKCCMTNVNIITFLLKKKKNVTDIKDQHIGGYQETNDIL